MGIAASVLSAWGDMDEEIITEITRLLAIADDDPSTLAEDAKSTAIADAARLREWLFARTNEKGQLVYHAGDDLSSALEALQSTVATYFESRSSIPALSRGDSCGAHEDAADDANADEEEGPYRAPSSSSIVDDDEGAVEQSQAGLHHSPAPPHLLEKEAGPEITIAYYRDPTKLKNPYKGQGVPAALEEGGLRLTPITTLEIIRGDLSSKRFSLLLVPGGYAPNYEDALGSHGAEQIRKFVAEGGGYVGICAGAYLGCKDWLDLLPDVQIVDIDHWAKGRSENAHWARARVAHTCTHNQGCSRTGSTRRCACVYAHLHTFVQVYARAYIQEHDPAGLTIASSSSVAQHCPSCAARLHQSTLQVTKS
jgi:putative intracellular protease/amidase